MIASELSANLRFRAVDVSHRRTRLDPDAVGAARHADPLLGAVVHQWRLNLAYAASGGTLNGVDLSEWLAAASSVTPGAPQGQATSRVAHWIVARSVVAFDGPAGWLLPRFQFDPTLRSVRPEVAALLAELTPVLAADAVAVWFVSPNVALGGVQPVMAIDHDPAAVLLAARAAREAACPA